MSAPVVVLVTFPSWEVARSISSALVGEGVAACVNLLPGAESVYRWEGKVEVASEIVGLVKTTKVSIEALQDLYLRLHPYDLPEFLTIDTVGGSSAYLDWLGKSTAAGGVREEQ